MKVVLIAAGAVALLAPARPDAYLLSGPEPRVTCSTGAELTQLQAMQALFGDHFLWARRHGIAYVIRDAALLQQAHSFFAPVAALAPAQEAVSREETTLDDEEERLEAIEEHSADSPVGRTSATGSRAEHDFEARLQEVRTKQRDVSRRERELDEREEALEREAEGKLWRLVDDAIRSGAARDQR